MSWKNGTTSGWAAFDQKQRQKQGLKPQHGNSNDPYPPVSASFATSTKHNSIPTRSFSSVLVEPATFPGLLRSKDFDSRSLVGPDSNSQHSAFKKLKELHSWADHSLLEDVMAAVSNNIDEASSLLNAMASSQNTEKDKKETICDSLGIDDICSALENRLRLNYNQLEDVYASCGEMLSDGTSGRKLILERLGSIPIEPEWEEDDVYLIYRKDAIKMMRSASQHSRAATNAFLRGDHISAQKHSRKAQEEWSVAETLNTEAAKEILSIRNINNDTWILDLHGLHAAEAVRALQERLRRIETQEPASKKRSVSPARGRQAADNRILRSSSQESLDKQLSSLRQRTTSLQVITGVGNHSRGEASLPTAVRSFLNENRYRYDEPRPGVITVRPKFYHR